MSQNKIIMYGFAILLIGLLLFATVYFLFAKHKKCNKNDQSSSTIQEKPSVVSPSTDLLAIDPRNVLNPIEQKILHSIVMPINNRGLTVDQINKILCLTDLSESNQRQKRHLAIKKLNLKLYLITGSKANIIRTSHETDKRLKYYSLELNNVIKIKKIAELLLTKLSCILVFLFEL